MTIIRGVFLGVAALLVVACGGNGTHTDGPNCENRCGMVEGSYCGECGYGTVCSSEGYCVASENEPVVYPDEGTTDQNETVEQPETENSEIPDFDFDYGHAKDPSSCGGEPFLAKSVSAGDVNTCAITPEGALYCWGSNTSHQLMTGDTNKRLCPVRLGEEADWSQVTTSYFSVCAIKEDRTLWCWGSNNSDQLGLGGYYDRTEPEQVGTARWKKVISGMNGHRCGIQEDDTLWCWGYNNYRQTGIVATGVSVPHPTQVLTGSWKSVDGGQDHSCAVKGDGTLWCWGWDGYGQLGNGEFADATFPPLQSGSDADWVSAALGWGHTCALKKNGELWCWGDGNSGQLGIGTYVTWSIPQKVSSENSWKYLDAGNSHTCAIAQDLSLWCWGNNVYGAIGNGSFDYVTWVDTTVPGKVESSRKWIGVSAGDTSTCGITTENELYCWGGNEKGQLGVGDKENRIIPIAVTY